MNNKNLVEVWNYPKISLAELGRYKLIQSGIESEIFGGKVDSYYLSAIGGLSLMVKSSDFEQAKKILEKIEDIDDNVVLREDEIQEGKIYCSTCHSKNIRIKKIKYFGNNSVFKTKLWNWFGYKQIMFCKNCKKFWRTK